MRIQTSTPFVLLVGHSDQLLIRRCFKVMPCGHRAHLALQNLGPTTCSVIGSPRVTTDTTTGCLLERMLPYRLKASARPTKHRPA